MKSFKMLLAAMIITISAQASAELVRIPNDARVSTFLEKSIVMVINTSMSSIAYEYTDSSTVNISDSLSATFYATAGKKVTLQAGSKLVIAFANNPPTNNYVVGNITLKNSEKYMPYFIMDAKDKTWGQLRAETQDKVEFYIDETSSELVF